MLISPSLLKRHIFLFTRYFFLDFNIGNMVLLSMTWFCAELYLLDYCFKLASHNHQSIVKQNKIDVQVRTTKFWVHNLIKQQGISMTTPFKKNGVLKCNLL